MHWQHGEGFEIVNCVNNGNISATGKCGGIVGRIYNEKGIVLIKECVSANLGIYGSVYNTAGLTVEN